MRIRLNLDDDLLETVKFVAKLHKIPVGKVLSELARQSLNSERTAYSRNGFILMRGKSPGKPVTMELINRRRDEE